MGSGFCQCGCAGDATARTRPAAQLADIVLLDRNPLDDLRNAETPWRVMKGGVMFDARRMREN